MDTTLYGTAPLTTGYSTENGAGNLWVGLEVKTNNPTGKSIKGVRIYVPSDSTSDFSNARAIVWKRTGTSVTSLAIAEDFDGITPGQWNDHIFSSPIDVASSPATENTWFVGVYLPDLGYAFDPGAFASVGKVSADDPDFFAPPSTTASLANGLFRDGVITPGSEPGNVWFGLAAFNDTHYGTDVILTIPDEGGEIPANTAAPVVSGTTEVGQALSCTTGTWTGDPTPTYARQWQRNTGSGFTNISGATGSSYTLVGGDEGATIRCVVTATNTEGSVSANSNTVGPVTLPNSAPANTVAPVVTGTTQVGQVLSCTTGTWTGVPTPTYARQWQRDTGSGFANISGATGSSYTLVGADEDADIRCVVTATNSVGSVSANSNSVGPITLTDVPPSNTVAPVVSGTTQVGEILSCTTGTWSGSPTPTYARQWQRDTGSGFTNISGATGSSYTLVVADEDADIRCVVTATNTEGSVSANSNSVGPIAPEAPPPVIVNGNLKELSFAYEGEWYNVPLGDAVVRNRFRPEDYGAERDGVTDDTEAINDCIVAAVAAGIADGTNYAEVAFSVGTYLLSSPTIKGGDTLGNAQIPLPVIVPEDDQKFILKLIGLNRSSTMHWAQTNSLENVGTVLKSTLTGQSNDGTWGAPSIIGTPTTQVGDTGLAPYFSNMHVVIDGICVMAPEDPSVIGFDLRGAAQASVLDASAMTDEVVADLTSDPPTNTLGVGLYMPGAGNNAVADIGSFTCMGFYTGIAIAEHVTAQRLLIVCCNTAMYVAVGRLGVTTFHASVIDYFCAEAVSRMIDMGDTPTGRRFALMISSLDTEADDTGIHIRDPNDALRGVCYWHDYQAQAPLIDGAENYHIYDTANNVHYGPTWTEA